MNNLQKKMVLMMDLIEILDSGTRPNYETLGEKLLLEPERVTQWASVFDVPEEKVRAEALEWFRAAVEEEMES